MRKYDTPQCKSLKATHDTVQITFLKLLLFWHVVSSAADMSIHMHQIQIQDVARTWFSTLDPIDTGCVTKFHGRKTIFLPVMSDTVQALHSILISWSVWLTS